jgi:DtxR family Mn-dependent transcriptional regulator
MPTGFGRRAASRTPLDTPAENEYTYLGLPKSKVGKWALPLRIRDTASIFRPLSRHEPCANKRETVRMPDKHELTFSIQDYLRCIYELTPGGAPASTNAVAGRLRVSPASVTGMVQKLAALQPALVVYKKHHGVRLTRRGTQAALEVIRHHRLLETWLVRSLGYPWDEVHGEAEKLEHSISDELERRIATALGNPDRDPHGDPIPSERLIMPADNSIGLAGTAAGEEVIVRRVQADDPELLRHLDVLGLVPGGRLKVLEVSNAEHAVRVRVRGRRVCTLAPEVANRVFVETAPRKEELK